VVPLLESEAGLAVRAYCGVCDASVCCDAKMENSNRAMARSPRDSCSFGRSRSEDEKNVMALNAVLGVLEFA